MQSCYHQLPATVELSQDSVVWLPFLALLTFPLYRNVMSSQEVVDFIQSKITQKDENGVLRPLSSIVEEVRSITPLQLLHHRFQPTVFLHPSLVPDLIPSPSDWFVQRLGYLAALGLQRWLVQEQRATSELEFGSFVTLTSVSDL